MLNDCPGSSGNREGGVGQHLGSFSEGAIRSELQHLLESPEFRASKRCQDFLSFVVEQTLSGHAGNLKERTIGVQAFGRSSSYDTNEDGVVRIKASEVRKRLGLYYAGTGKNCEIRIDLPVGGYTPIFASAHAADTAVEAPSDSPVANLETPALLDEHPHGASGRSLRKAWLAAGFTLFIVLSATAWAMLRRPGNILDQFWAPVLKSPSPVLVAAAYVPVYVSNDETSPRRPGAPEEFTMLTDQFVGGGDLVAASRVSGMLSRIGHPYTVRIGGVAFEDLRSAPTVLIGYSAKRWEAISKQLRFFMDGERGYITDNGKPTSWYPRHTAHDFHTDEDYAIISRVFLPQTHTMLVQLAGYAQYGTEAAAEVVTSPDLLAEALQGAPKGWQRKNVQLVLHMQVISNYPTAPKVIASHYW